MGCNMALFFMILNIISAIPSIIRVIQDIMAIIKGLKGEEKKEAISQLRVILKKHTRKDKPVAAGAAKSDLEALRERLVNKFGSVD